MKTVSATIPLIESSSEYAKNPVVGHFWTDMFSFVCIVLAVNEHVVLIANKKCNEDTYTYEVDYTKLEIISRADFEKYGSWAEVVRPEKDYSRDYQNLIANKVLKPIELPGTKEKAKEYFDTLKRQKETEEFKHKSPVVSTTMMRPMHNADTDTLGYYIELPNGTYIDIELKDGVYSFFVRDNKDQEGFAEIPMKV